MKLIDLLTAIGVSDDSCEKKPDMSSGQRLGRL